MSNQLATTDTLVADQQLTATNGKSILLMRTDGNLVLLRIDSYSALWSSNTSNPSGAAGNNYALMQADGSLVVCSAQNDVLWSTNTSGNPGAFVTLDEDGNLILSMAIGTPLWATNTVQPDFTASVAAAATIWPEMAIIGAEQVYPSAHWAPGWEYKARYNGADFADAAFGLAQTSGLAMTNDTIIHVASMSKPICVTAFFAMLDDWSDLAQGVMGTGPLAATHIVQVEPPLPHPPPTPPYIGQPLQPPSNLPSYTLAVPGWMLPAMSSAPLASQLVADGILTIVPAGLQTAFKDIAAAGYRCVPEPSVPPGYAGLLGQVIKGVAVPQPSDDFLPLIQSMLSATAQRLGVQLEIGAHVDGVKIEKLITHMSSLRNGITDSTILPLIPAAVIVQPTNGGPVTCDIWAYLLAYLRQPADATTGYKNDDYNVLGGIIAACVGTDYDDYVYSRLFDDPKFSTLRRYVTGPGAACYYHFTGPGFNAGNPFPDFRGFGASGGFYYTANQITMWMYSLYTRASVQLGSGASGALISQNALNMLFGSTAYFSAGITGTVSGWTTYIHDGSTGIGAGSCNGTMGLAVNASGGVITAFFCANGSGNGAGPYLDAFSSILPYVPST